MEEWMIVLSVIAGIGAISILIWIIGIIYRCTQGIKLDAYKYGTVCVTGATDGIGKCIAYEFLRRGFKVLIISRSQQKLEQVAEELTKKTENPNISVLQVDFSDCHKNPEEFFGELYTKLEPFNISVLVNNVGILESQVLQKNSLEGIERMLAVNVYPQTFLTKFLLNDFLKRYEKTHLRSLFIHISSIGARAYSPMFTVYGATKKFNEFFGTGLSYEIKHAIDTAVVLPAQVTTELVHKEVKKMTLNVTPEKFASALIGGLKKGDNFGPWEHRLFAFMMDSLPYECSVMFMRCCARFLLKPA